MPQRKSDILELTRGKTSEVIGNLAILTTVKGQTTGYGHDLPTDKIFNLVHIKNFNQRSLIFKSMLLTK